MRVGIDIGSAFSTLARRESPGAGVHRAQPAPSARIASVVTLVPEYALVGHDAPEVDPGAVVARDLKAALGTELRIVDGAGRQWTGDGLCALLIRELLNRAHASAEETGQAVLTVPPGLPDGRRRGLRDAALLAGLPAIRIVESGVASAAAYVHSRKPRDVILLVCDAGHTGFAATLLACAGSDLFVVATEFTEAGGTRAMDAAIAGVFERQSEVLHGGEGPERGSHQGAWIMVGERLRRGLSGARRPVASHLVLVGGRAVEATLSRTQLGQVLRPVLDAVESTIQRCLGAAALSRSAVQCLLLTGGGAHTVPLRRRVALSAGREPVTIPGVEPEEVSAVGAAVLAEQLTPGDNGAASMRVRHGAPLELLVNVLDETQVLHQRPLIDKNTPLPVERSHTVSGGSHGKTRVRFEPVQPAGPEGRTQSVGVLVAGPIEVSAEPRALELWLGYDQAGFVVAGAREPRTGRSIPIETEGAGARAETTRLQNEYLRGLPIEPLGPAPAPS